MGAMKNRISEWRKRAGMSQDQLGIALGSGRSTVTKLERGEIPLTDRWMTRLAEVLGCKPIEILDGGLVPTVGKIGAGGAVAYIDDYEFGGASDYTQRPPDIDGQLVGLEVEGDSMLPKFDPGDVIYISKSNDGVLSDYYGKFCACRLTTGGTLLKKLARGSGPGLYTLRSLNAADIEDVELDWATPVVAVRLR
jgi:phage repressor protein C with HTH and peptisase S24 domain